MKICVFGAGAIGGYLAVELALAGNEVCVIARGRHLDAIRHDGLRLRIGGQERIARVPASDEPADFGPQEVVVCSLKAHQAWQWWYFYGSGGALEGYHLESVDPGARHRLRGRSG